ncbi:MAG: type II toxin-antitoxin system VapC family toxin [Pseudomonadota bacterium]|nr:type II toxin-antitoxin system VapC family toxin [Pseudomonadota bacterium]
MKILLDTSALAKRYKREPGCESVDDWLAQADEVVLAAHCKMEIASAFLRDVHDQILSTGQYALGMREVAVDFTEFAVLPVSPDVESLAIAAMQRTRLRAMDALHIGTAQAAGVDLFVTADRQQARAAEQAGLRVEMVSA